MIYIITESVNDTEVDGFDLQYIRIVHVTDSYELHQTTFFNLWADDVNYWKYNKYALEADKMVNQRLYF